MNAAKQYLQVRARTKAIISLFSSVEGLDDIDIDQEIIFNHVLHKIKSEVSLISARENKLI
jgi:hypothetical protein